MSYKDPEVQKQIMARPKALSKEELERELERLHAQEERYVKGAKLAQDLSNMVNSMAHDDETRGFIDELNHRTHRTLQQSSFGLVMRWIYSLAGLGDNYIDGRNEYTVKTAKQIKGLLGPYGAGTPFI